MHQHNPDFIMALAEGLLPASAMPAAETEIAACAECSADLEAQRIALSALRDAPAARLSATERLSLHDTLRKELHLTDVSAPRPAEPKRRRSWSATWALGGAAAVLVAVLAVAPALRLISQGDDDAADATFAAETSEALTSTTAALSMADDRVVPTDAVGEDSLAGANLPESQAPLAAGDTTTTAPASGLDRVALATGDSPQETLTEFFTSYERAAGDPDIAVQLYAKAAPQTTPAPAPTACAAPEGIGIPGGATSFTVAVVLIDRVAVPVVGFAVPGATDIVLVVFVPDTCDVLFSLP